MSVLQCSRSGCENIMSEYYSEPHGYLCWECHRELLNKPGINIAAFMRTPKVTNADEISKDEWEQFVNARFEPR